MAIDPRLLEILCCPLTRIPLKPADAELLRATNDHIANSALFYTNGEKVEAPLKEGLVTEDKKMLYRIDDDILIMLPDKAIRLGFE